jgi:hypothetical protein
VHEYLLVICYCLLYEVVARLEVRPDVFVFNVCISPATTFDVDLLVVEIIGEGEGEVTETHQHVPNALLLQKLLVASRRIAP